MAFLVLKTTGHSVLCIKRLEANLKEIRMEIGVEITIMSTIALQSHYLQSLKGKSRVTSIHVSNTIHNT